MEETRSHYIGTSVFPKESTYNFKCHRESTNEFTEVNLETVVWDNPKLITNFGGKTLMCHMCVCVKRVPPNVIY